MGLQSISVKNFRAFRDKATFPLKPLIFAVGANSTGKSSYARLFPLFRQSTETVTKGPILWFGEYVDFGIFDSVVTQQSSTNEIEFEFATKLLQPKTRLQRASSYWGYQLQLLDDIEVTTLLVLSSENKLTYTKRIEINILDTEFRIHGDSEGLVKSIEMDGKELEIGRSEIALISDNGFFSLQIRTNLLRKIKDKVIGSSRIFPYISAFRGRVLAYLKPLYHGGTGGEKIRTVAQNLGIGSIASLGKNLKVLCQHTNTSSKRASERALQPKSLLLLQKLLLADRLPLILDEINSQLVNHFKKVRYLAPLRATAQRYYRQRDLAIDEVDPEGTNLAMYLMGLTPSEKRDFSKWCESKMGFSVTASGSGSHVSILIQNTNEPTPRNIVDMGFGYSQLLPLLSTVWANTRTNKKSQTVTRPELIQYRRSNRFSDTAPTTIVVEQPELHLHPKLQAQFADLLASIVVLCEESSIPIQIICETHSETIINRIGLKIAESQLPKESVAVILFESDQKTNATNVSLTGFDSDGVLKDWPYGFFLPKSDY